MTRSTTHIVHAAHSYDENGNTVPVCMMAAGTKYDQNAGKQIDSYRNNSGTAYGINLIGNK